ncbi:MAG: hypothetical protein NZ777_13990, partial [Pseudomonadales bacterium]|nr:hypothetical protein [Pseudomonadales bacterium]
RDADLIARSDDCGSDDCVLAQCANTGGHPKGRAFVVASGGFLCNGLANRFKAISGSPVATG